MQPAPTAQSIPAALITIPPSKLPVSSNSFTFDSWLPFLWWPNSYESFVEQQIVDDFQCAGDEEWRIVEILLTDDDLVHDKPRRGFAVLFLWGMQEVRLKIYRESVHCAA